MKRALIIVLDSFGIGSSEDALHYGDVGANTFLHIAEQYPLYIPNLTRLGLYAAAQMSSGEFNLKNSSLLHEEITAAYGYAVEKSKGKDTPSGHWEIAGVPILEDWGYFPPEYPSFPESLLQRLIQRGGLAGVLGNKHASGTEIISELGEEHQKTQKPIVYTSGDSVFQIAAHEDSFGLQRLYDLCIIARELMNEYRVGRVIARPFLGEPGHYYRTGNRRDYAVPPPELTLLDYLISAGREVIAIGKISDIYAHRGISKAIKADGNMALVEACLKEMKTAPDGSLVFVNLVDFDMVYGHRRDVVGYAKALEAFDARLPELYAVMQPNDFAVITADHGCDPTWQGSDHTREHVPILAWGADIKPGFIGRRETFADIGQSIAKHLGIAPLRCGEAFI